MRIRGILLGLLALMSLIFPFLIVFGAGVLLAPRITSLWGKSENTVFSYVKDAGTSKVHKISCEHAKEISERNRTEFFTYTSARFGSVEAIPCKYCLLEAYCEYERRNQIEEDAEWLEEELNEAEDMLTFASHVIEFAADHLGLTFDELVEWAAEY